MRKTKWASHKFSADETNARHIWRRAEIERSEIVQALKSCDHFMSRDDMHKRLDRRLDAIERSMTRAQSIFPDVEESFTVAKMTVTL